MPANTRLPRLQSEKSNGSPVFARSAANRVRASAARARAEASRRSASDRISGASSVRSPPIAEKARRASPSEAPAGKRRSRSSISAGEHDWRTPASRDAFFRKSDGPRLSPSQRRTSPVEAPSSYPLMAIVSEIAGLPMSWRVRTPEPRPPENRTTLSCRAPPARSCALDEGTGNYRTRKETWSEATCRIIGRRRTRAWREAVHLCWRICCRTTTIASVRKRRSGCNRL